MMNPDYHIGRMRELVEEFEPSRERSLAITKLDEFEMWLARCTPTAEARNRDLSGPIPQERHRRADRARQPGCAVTGVPAAAVTAAVQAKRSVEFAWRSSEAARTSSTRSVGPPDEQVAAAILEAAEPHLADHLLGLALDKLDVHTGDRIHVQITTGLLIDDREARHVADRIRYALRADLPVIVTDKSASVRVEPDGTATRDAELATARNRITQLGCDLIEARDRVAELETALGDILNRFPSTVDPKPERIGKQHIARWRATLAGQQ